MEQHWIKSDITAWERFYRIAFVNSLAGAKPLFLVGTQNAAGQHNLAPFHNIVHVGANPPLLGILFRPAMPELSHTWHNLETWGACTLNAVHAGMLAAAHATSAKFPAGESEFSAAGLTPKTAASLPAPYVAESRLRIGCTLVEWHTVQANQTRFAVLAVEEVFLPADATTEDGFVQPSRTGSLSAVGLDAYGPAGTLTRLPYAHAPSTSFS